MNEKWDIEVDLVSVGSGIGGLSAAIVAHDAGAEVVILEKTAHVGGLTAYSGGEIWCGANHLEEERGIADSEDDTRAYLHYISGGEYVEDNLESVVRNAPDTVRYFTKEVGIPFGIHNLADYYYPDAPGSVEVGRMLSTAPIAGADLGEWQGKVRMSPHLPSGITHNEMFAWGGLAVMDQWDADVMAERAQQDIRTFGPGLAAHFVKAALIDRAILCRTGTRATELVTRGEKVVGVRAATDDGHLLVKARRGVVIATSGYDGNPQMARLYEGAREWQTTAFPGLTGDGLTMGAEIGGAVVSARQDQGFPGLPPVPGETHDGAALYRLPHASLGLPHSIVVNREGRRFADESFYPMLLAALQEFDGRKRQSRNFPCFMIVDQTFRDRYLLGGVLPGQSLPEGFGVEASSMRAMAEALEIDADGLEETVARFNQFAREGEDLDFGRGNFLWSRQMWGDPKVTPNSNLGPIERAPFYGIPLTPIGVGINNAGLMTNGNANVVHVRGHGIPGLYAVGNAAAYLDLLRGYQSGYANARGLVFGRLAARHAMARPEDELE